MSGTTDRARACALVLLARREHSELELRRKLARRGCTSADIEEVLAALARDGALSEERYVEAYVRERAEQGFGPHHILQGLRMRGVPEALAAIHVAAYEEQWPERLRALAARRLHGRSLDDRREWVRQARYFQNRGFAPELIRRVLGDYGQDE